MKLHIHLFKGPMKHSKIGAVVRPKLKRIINYNCDFSEVYDLINCGVKLNIYKPEEFVNIYFCI